jgi:ectoine hydroxylase-related dioxygenase (phytanoyl-CoA dioxygenase family)
MREEAGMNDIERYEFDRTGYIVIKQMLSREQARDLLGAVNELEAHALAHIAEPPRKKAAWGNEYHLDAERGYHAWGERADGKTLMIEDFWNATPAFDGLLDHPRTMQYISAIVQGRFTINNSEIRIRYPGNATGTHMGGPIDHKYRYAFTNGRIDCMMVRMIYFLHDVAMDQGPFCVVPGTHKSNMKSPYGGNPDEEPGMIGLPVQAGDAILFTEHLRHGGFTNRSTQTRKTLHVGYGPFWMMSQNIATMDEPPYITEDTRARLTPAQNALFRAWPMN